MADLIEYIRWRGDLTFSERPFNNIDNLVLSQVCYQDLEGIAPAAGQGSISLHEAAEQYFTGDLDRGMITGQDWEQNNQFFSEVSRSRRFCGIRISDYVNEIDSTGAKRTQFCAMLFTLPDGSRYIAYRGTDDTVVGWEEDFMLSYTVTEAQEKALQYMVDLLHRYPSPRPGLLDRLSGRSGDHRRERWMAGGHSKGGNLAVYAAARLPLALQDRIEGVYDNDGPGFDREVLSPELFDRIRGRVRKIVPEYSVIGMLLEDPQVRRNLEEQDEWLMVVRSSGKKIMQHWALTWQVEGTDFCRAEGLDTQAEKIDSLLDRWISSATFDEREAFVSTLFGAMKEVGPNISDVMANGRTLTRTLTRDFLHSDPETRTAVAKFFLSLYEEGMDSMPEHIPLIHRSKAEHQERTEYEENDNE